MRKLTNALLLPVNELNALIKGQTIFCYPQVWIDRELTFGLCAMPDDDPETIEIVAWAKAQQSVRFQEEHQDLSIIQEAEYGEWYDLAQRLKNNPIVVVTALQVYRLPQPEKIKWRSEFRQNFRRFIPQNPVINGYEKQPTLSEAVFQDRLNCLTTRQPPQLLQCIDGWLKQSQKKVKSTDDWIDTIVELGNGSDGTAFENVVRKSLEFLGFTVSEAHVGGAGGLDLYCSAPFPLVGECKAGKKIPNSATKQLAGLGIDKLGHEGYQHAAKVIIGPGQPTKQMLGGAQTHKIIIICPEILQDLVKLQASYPGSVQLRPLEPIFKACDIEQLKQHIQAIKVALTRCLSIRKLLRQICGEVLPGEVSSEALFTAYRIQETSDLIDLDNFRHILIRLTSPEIGYIGRNGDRYYPIRSLP